MRAPVAIVAIVALVVLSALGCGTNRPDIPDDLKNPSTGTCPSGYPAGPYGAGIGDTAPCLTFQQGWLDPLAAGFDPAALAPISFNDFHDPTGTTNEILLVNTAAIWCQACKVEHGGSGQRPSLNEHAETLGPKGLVILSLLFEDGEKEPADEQNLGQWTQSYATAFPMALDPEYQMKVFQPNKSLAPYNVAIDLRTMKVLEFWVGDHPEETWPFIEQILDERAASGD